ncbi:MAG: class B sortase [Bilifractor sp.]|jgi:sortase B
MKKRVRRAVELVFVLTCVAVIIYGLYAIGKKLCEYDESRKAYDELKSVAVEEDPGEEDPGDEEPAQEQESVETSSAAKSLVIDWSSMPQDAVAWLVLDDISYPVMQGSTDSWYEHRLPDGTYNYGGSLFLLSDTPPDLSDQNTVIYGHNMADGSMFGQLKRYKDPAYHDHEFYLYLPDGTVHVYRFFSVCQVDKNNAVYTSDFEDDAAFLSWQEHLKERSVYKNTEVPDSSAGFVTLSTCDGKQGTSSRLTVIGKEVSVMSTVSE